MVRKRAERRSPAGVLIVPRGSEPEERVGRVGVLIVGSSEAAASGPPLTALAALKRDNPKMRRKPRTDACESYNKEEKA